MIKRDILAELSAGDIDERKAQEVFEDILASPNAGEVINLLGFTSLEYRAYCHGTPLLVLAKWRERRWPSYCSKCKTHIDIEKDYWWAEGMRGGKYSLRHVECS